MAINEKIFKAYDIRGVYPADLDEDAAYKIGQAFAVYTGCKSAVVGHDMRVSSPSLFKEVVRGLTDMGIEVKDIGLVSSDMFYYACGSMNMPGIMVTASHNPKEYNGFKMVKDMPQFISQGQGMEEIRDLVKNNEFKLSDKKGAIQTIDISSGFKEKVFSCIDIAKIPPLKIVVDAANGMGGKVVEILFKDLPVKIIPLYFEPDGTFPNHGGDPLQEENRRDLVARVLAEKADLGFAFDPDGDRFFIIDDRGQFIPGDFMTAIFGRYLIEKHVGGSVVYDLRASSAVKDLVTAAGGVAIENRVGHSYIKPRMQAEKAVFGGEVTGHYYFSDFYYADSGAVPSLLVLELLGHYKKTLREILAPLEEKYFISGEFNFKVADADLVLNNIKTHYQSQYKIEEIDGISVIADNWHANIRKSNTEPLVRLNLEAVGDKNLMEEKKNELIKIIQS